MSNANLQDVRRAHDPARGTGIIGASRLRLRILTTGDKHNNLTTAVVRYSQSYMHAVHIISDRSSAAENVRTPN